jgi:protein TonB
MPSVFRRRFSVAFAALLSIAALAAASPRIAGAQDDKQVYAGEDLTTPPKIASMMAAARLVQRSYPEALRRQGVSGLVQVQFIVGSDGKVEAGSVEIVAASVAGLGDAAKGVVPKLEFTPGKVNDKPVRSRVVLPLTYKAE